MSKKTVEEPITEPTFSLGLNLELGRQDLNENFRKIEEAINKLMNK